MSERLKKRNRGGAPHVANKKKTKPVKKNTVEPGRGLAPPKYGPVIDTNRKNIQYNRGKELAPPRRQPLNPGYLAPPKYLGDLNNTDSTIGKIKKFLKDVEKANKIKPSLKERFGK